MLLGVLVLPRLGSGIFFFLAFALIPYPIVGRKSSVSFLPNKLPTPLVGEIASFCTYVLLILV